VPAIRAKPQLIQEENMNRNRKITLMALTLTAVFGFWSTAFTQTQKDPANAAQAFDKLKTLAGRWEATTEKGKASASFQVVSGGTALLERTDMPGEKEMITVYHLDGNRLLLTHYCEEGNQPRMQAASFDPKTNEIDFSFLDATNLASPEAGHMHHAVLKLHGPNELAENWTFNQGGKPAFTVPVLYHRVD
jgi:hypothetical protein